MLKLLQLALYGLVALALAGCGTYRPLYGSANGGQSVVASLSSMTVQEQHDRAGQLVRNELLDGVKPNGPSRYELHLVVHAPEMGVPQNSSTGVALARYSLNAHYELFDTAANKMLTSGETFSNVDYDTVKIPVADLAAADAARSRAATEVGQDIKLRIATYLSAHQG